MKAVIIFDSVYGNTKKIAEAILEGLHSKESKCLQVKEATSSDLAGVSLLVVGSPTHGGWFTESIKAYMETIPHGVLKDLHVATFDTSSPKKGQGIFVNTIAKIFGNAAPRIAKTLTKKGASVVDTEIFLVDGKEGPLVKGEKYRAKKWGEELLKKINS